MKYLYLKNRYFYLRRLCEYKGVEIVEDHAMSDYIHMFVKIPPKIAVSSFMGYLKGKSSLMIFWITQTWNISMETEIFGRKDILVGPGKISHQLAIQKSTKEYENTINQELKLLKCWNFLRLKINTFILIYIT